MPSYDPYNQPIAGGQKQSYASQNLMNQMGGLPMPLPTGMDQPSVPKSSPSASGVPSDYYNIDSPNFLGPSSQSQDSGGMSMSSMMQAAMQQAQLNKMLEDYQAQVKMAKFMLPQTLNQIGSQYGAQGDYYSSGRRQQQQTAIYKTSFDIQQAKRDYQLQQLMTQMQMAQQMMGRSN